ncbi:MAG: hypothetical protein UHX00_10260 [Caryophanon sp.]|nr:hypothetical protein [Caryophanon sp.]
MQRTLSIRGRYFIAAIAFTMISLLLALFVPLTYGETKYFGLDVDYWFIPFQNYTLFAAALSCIVLALIILGFVRHIASYIVAALLAVSAVVIGYWSFLGVTTIDEDKLFVRTAFDEQTYYWQSITSITLLYDEQDGSEQYMFTLSDGSNVHMANTAQLNEAKSFIYATARTHDIPYTEKREQ